MTSAELECALAKGVEFLLRQQQEDGGWEDYHSLPVGPATEWVTAFVAAALLDTGDERARRAATRAVDHLLAVHCSPEERGGWGYNAATGPDADSTAWTLAGLRRTDRPLPPAAVAFLVSLHRDDGGFATYPRNDGWGCSHPDVAPLAVLALPAPQRQPLLASVAAYSLRTVCPDGSWPAYWWRGRHYSTYWNRAFLAAMGRTPPRLHIAPTDSSRQVETAFDLAWVLATALLEGDSPEAVAEWAQQLVRGQHGSGQWPGGLDLRVTAPFCRVHSALMLGKQFLDDVGLITTASAVRALALLLGRGSHIPLPP